MPDEFKPDIPETAIPAEGSELFEIQQRPDQQERQTFLRRSIAALTVAAAGGALVFEQSPLNEALRINVGLDVLKSTRSAAAVGLAITALTAVIEMVPSTLISVGLNSDGGAIQRLKNRLSRKNRAVIDEEQPSEGGVKPTFMGQAAGKAANAGIALGLGAGLVTVKEHLKDPDPTLAKDMATSAKASGIVAGVSGSIGYLAAGGINHANGTVLEKPAELFVDYGTDTRFWVGALAIGYGVYYINKGIRSLRGRRNAAERIASGEPEPFSANTGSTGAAGQFDVEIVEIPHTLNGGLSDNPEAI